MCSSSQGDQPFNITWLKDQRTIYTRRQKQLNDEKHLDNDSAVLRNDHPSSYYIDNTIHINEYAPFSSILSIENLTSNHNGNYTCRISNTGGVVDHTAVLSVAGSLNSSFLLDFKLFFHLIIISHMKILFFRKSTIFGKEHKKVCSTTALSPNE